MNCKNHNEVQAAYICDKCKQPICEACAQDIGGGKICKSCIEQALYSKNSKAPRRGFFETIFFFLLSCIPGAAHMYMGLFKRGVQLMIAFIAAFPIFIYINVESLIVVIVIPIWFFSFFDGYNSRRKLINGEYPEDIEVLDYKLILKYKRYIGVSMLIIGIIGFTNAFDFSFFRHGNIWLERINQVLYPIKRSVIPLILIFVGFKILTRSSSKAQDMDV